MTERTNGSRALARDATFSQQTEVALREMILAGEIAPGQRINEVALAHELGISRGPLREAIQRLVSGGLLTVISHRGAFVRTFTLGEVGDLYGLRTALELQAVRMVCERATDEELSELDAMLSETEAVMSQQRGHAYPQELDFHLRLVTLAGNQALTRAALETHHQISLARSMSAKRPLRARAAVVEHHELVQALQQRDVARAVELMDTHLKHSMDSALEALGLPKEPEKETDS